MRNKITMEMSICQAENGFSLDELVKKFTDGGVAKLKILQHSRIILFKLKIHHRMSCD